MAPFIRSHMSSY